MGAVLCGYAAARARELMRWLVAMLDHTEGVQQRLQVIPPLWLLALAPREVRGKTGAVRG